MWHVYILECRDGRLYTGITNDLDRRVRQHRKGTGAKFTRSFGAGAIVYCERLATRALALRREAAIKRLNRRQKMILRQDSTRDG